MSLVRDIQRDTITCS